MFSDCISVVCMYRLRAPSIDPIHRGQDIFHHHAIRALASADVGNIHYALQARLPKQELKVRIKSSRTDPRGARGPNGVPPEEMPGYDACLRQHNNAGTTLEAYRGFC